MQDASNDADAALFNMVHALIQEQQAADAASETAERRSVDRTAYSCVQLLAPFDGQRMPPQSEFGRVHCRDLSPSGFSFYADARLIAQQVIIALGSVPFKFLAAQVVRQTTDDEQGQVLIGCRFSRRIA